MLANKPLHRRLLLLQLRHWDERISLEQANNLRRCLYSAEMGALELWKEKAFRAYKEKIGAKDEYEAPKSRAFSVDEGKERFAMKDAFGRNHIITY